MPDAADAQAVASQGAPPPAESVAPSSSEARQACPECGCEFEGKTILNASERLAELNEELAEARAETDDEPPAEPVPMPSPAPAPNPEAPEPKKAARARKILFKRRHAA